MPAVVKFDQDKQDQEIEVTPEMIEAGIQIFRKWRYDPDNLDQLELGELGDVRCLIEAMFRYCIQSQRTL